MNTKEWAWVQEQSGTCILSMAMQFNTNKITVEELMDKIEEHCELSYKVASQPSRPPDEADAGGTCRFCGEADCVDGACEFDY